MAQSQTDSFVFEQYFSIRARDYTRSENARRRAYRILRNGANTVHHHFDILQGKPENKDLQNMYEQQKKLFECAYDELMKMDAAILSIHPISRDWQQMYLQYEEHQRNQGAGKLKAHTALA